MPAPTKGDRVRVLPNPQTKVTDKGKDLAERVRLLPVLVGVVEVLLGVLDLAHVHHHHLSINLCSTENSPPKIISGNPRQTYQIAQQQEQDYDSRVNISRETREIDGFRGRRRRRRRAYLGVGAEWSRCGWCESSRRSVCWGRRCRTDGNGMRSVFKRKRRGAAVGWEMDGRDGPGRIGQVVVADRRIQGRRGPDPRSNPRRACCERGWEEGVLNFEIEDWRE